MRRPQCVSPRGCWLARPTSGRQLDSFQSLWRPHVGGHRAAGIPSWSTAAWRKYTKPRGYWKGLTDIKKLASTAKISEDLARARLKKQAIWQIFLPAPRQIPGPYFGVEVPNEDHQADLLFLPHNRVGKRTFMYALTVVDVASRFKEAEPLTSKTTAEVAEALSRIYRRGPLKWPKLLQVDPGREFMSAVSQLLAKHRVEVRRGRVDIHRDQGIVELWNRTLAERLFGHQYAQEMRHPPGQRSTGWLGCKTGKKPSDAIKAKTVAQTPSSVVPDRLVGLKEPKPPSGVGVRFLYEPGELESGRRRDTDPVS